MIEYTYILRLFASFIFSLIFGIERQLSHKPIGFGTFIFVSTGSCALSIIALSLTPENPLPLLSSIVTGIGFLGAGALIKTSDRIFGFTSAASIWIFAILGLTIGVGNYSISLVIYAIIWIVLFVDKYFESKSLGSYQKKLYITLNKRYSKKELKKMLGLKKKKTLSVSINSEKGEY